jgi:hypothetical protein
MWAGSIGLVAGFLLIICLALVLAIFLASPFIAVAFFLLGFAAFLVWRGKRRSEQSLGTSYGSRVPTTEEAAADPVADSSIPDVARSSTDAQT